MSKEMKLIMMRCPTCGGQLRVENPGETIECLFCGNMVIPVTEQAAPEEKPALLRVEGINTSSSALAYMEDLLESYDWDSFVYDRAMTVAEMDRLVENLRVRCADDPNTWVLAFRALCVPYLKKAEACLRMFQNAAAYLCKEEVDGYSLFDSYKRIARSVDNHRTELVQQLQKLQAKAEKYGADAQMQAQMASDLQKVEAVKLPWYAKPEEIPQVRQAMEEKNARLVESLRAKGIDAERVYAEALENQSQGKYFEALKGLLSLEGYQDSQEKAKLLDKYFLFGDVLRICDRYYYFKREQADQPLRLHTVRDGVILKKPLVKDIQQIITNFAQKLYYISSDNKLKLVDLETGTCSTLGEQKFSHKSILSHPDGRSVLLLAHGKDEWNSKKALVRLELDSGAVSTLAENIQHWEKLFDKFLVCTQRIKSEDGKMRNITSVVDVCTGAVTVLGDTEISVMDCDEKYVLFTRKAPHAKNLNLFIRSMEDGDDCRCLEKNIYEYARMGEGKVYYWIGRDKTKTLVCCHVDGTGRKEVPVYMSEFLFKQGRWNYYIRRAGHNAVLCRNRENGLFYSVVAGDVDRYLDIKGGFLYYVNYKKELMRVRMDGSNAKKLCDDMQEVLILRDDKVVFLARDGAVRSIYEVEFEGAGLRKLAYDVQSAKMWDDNTVYFTQREEKKNEEGALIGYTDVLYNLQVDERTVTQEVIIPGPEAPKSGVGLGCGCSIFIGAVGFLLMVVGAADVPELVGFGAVALVAALIVGGISAAKKE